MEKNNLYIVWHLGMGDIIICAPIVRQLAPMYELIVIPVKHHNVPSANYLFRDLPNVAIRGVCDDDEMEMWARDVWKFKTIRLGGTGNYFVGSQWDKSFYKQADLPFDTRWTQWKCARDLEAENKVAQKASNPNVERWRVFLHDDPQRGMLINFDRWGKLVEAVVAANEEETHVRIIRPSPEISPILFHWRTVIEACDEIHCISSSFAAFIDSIHLPKNPKMFLHAYCRPGEPLCEYRKAWHILA